MSIGKRLLWIVLLLTVVAAIWPVPENNIADGVADRSSIVRNQASAPGVSRVLSLRALTPQTSTQEREIIDLFPRQGWTETVVDTLSKPEAPPLPFTYGGRYTEGNKVIVYLNEGANMRAAHQGDTIDATYRIDNITPAEIMLTYLPLNLKQTLHTGSPTPP